MELNEAGRMLSRENEKKLRTAAEALSQILSLLDDQEESQSEEAQESRRKLSEAANMGHWLESRIHLAFTEMADHMFGEGRLTREERMALSAAVGDALTAFNASIAENAPQLYEREPWMDPEAETEMAESSPEPQLIETAFMPLVEQAVRRDGTIPIKVIEPGWGSSGYYSAEVLQRDGPQAFPAGTKQFWNHPTPQEEAERPEGDLNALAAEFVSDARWNENGPQGAGLYADAKVFGHYAEAIDELAPHIGVSIRANGRAVQGEAEGRQGPIIQEITSARSVDFVTTPGAGGRIIEMFEAARRPEPRQMSLAEQEPEQEESMTDEQLQETNTKLTELQQQNARLQEAMLLRDARDHVRERVATANVPDVTKGRLVESLSGNPPVNDSGALDTETYNQRIDEAVQAETEYLTKAAGYGQGRVEGMGGGGPQGGAGQTRIDELRQQREQTLRDMGLSEAEAQYAAVGH